MRWSLLAVAPALLIPLFSGCVSVPCTPGPLVSARGIGPETGSAGGDGPFTLSVLVQDPEGSAIPGAGVVLYWGLATPDQYRSEMARAEVGPSGTVVEPGATAGTPAAKEALRLRTGPDGRVEAGVPDNHLVGLVAAAPGWTEEWIGYVATGPAGAHATQALTLYPSHMEWTLNGTWSPAAVSTGSFTGGGYAWQPNAVDFGANPAGHLRRLVSLSATVTWSNGATGFGDLAVAFGTAGHASAIGDQGANAAPGAQEEALDLGVGDIEDYGFHGAGSLQVGPASGTAYVAPLGLPYTVHVKADLDRSVADAKNCLYIAWGHDADEPKRDDNAGFGASVQPAPAPVIRDAPVGGHVGAQASPAAFVGVLVAVVGAVLVARRQH